MTVACLGVLYQSCHYCVLISQMKKVVSSKVEKPVDEKNEGKWRKKFCEDFIKLEKAAQRR